MKTFLPFFASILLYFSLQGQESYSLVWDRYGSAIASAENLRSVHAATYEFKDRYLKHTYWEESNTKGKAFGIGYRLGKTILIDMQISRFAFLFQHEVFGHGYRFREFGYEGNTYRVNIGLPYVFGKGGGLAVPGIPSRSTGFDEAITTYFGGSEANTVFANTIRENWWVQKKLSYDETLLYGATRQDITVYILATRYLNEPGDVVNYFRLINSRYQSSETITFNNLANYTLLNLLDPYSYIAGIAYLKYLINAEDEMTLPTLHLGNVDWLPTVQFNLTPFGGEFHLVNSFRTTQATYHWTMRHGDNRFANFWGSSLQWLQLPSERVQFGATVDFWQQPSLRIGREGVEEEVVTRSGLGGRLLGHVRLPLTNVLHVRADVGYKTTGYTLGEALDQGLILRVGLSLLSINE